MGMLINQIETANSLSTIFFIAITLSVIPFYSLMIFAPGSSRTQRIMASLWPITMPVGIYVLFLLLIVLILRPDVLGLWRELYITRGLFNHSTVQFLSEMYGRFPEYATLHGWAHLVVGDMFMARWVFLDATQRAVKRPITAVIIALIGFVGPVGVLVYLLVCRFPAVPSID